MTQDQEQLKVLAIFHYVVAGLAGLFALLPVFHLIFGLFFIFASERFQGKGEPPPPAFLGWFFVVFAAILIILGLVFAGLVFTAGRFLAKRKHYLFCLVMAGVVCAFMPFGTVLGVFTIIVLVRESVKQLFAAGPLSSPLAFTPAAAPPAAPPSGAAGL
jgi:hypothetical protein